MTTSVVASEPFFEKSWFESAYSSKVNDIMLVEEIKWGDFGEDQSNIITIKASDDVTFYGKTKNHVGAVDIKLIARLGIFVMGDNDITF